MARAALGVGLSVVAAALLWSCIPLHRHGRVSDGPSRRGTALREDVRRERWNSALARLAADSARGGDELLRLQQLALVAHYSGDHETSNDALHRARRILEDRYTRRISRGFLAVLTSDRTLPYRPATTERLFLHYYGALNYLRLGELDEAAVEARQLSRALEGLGGIHTRPVARREDAAAGPPRSPAFRDLRCALHYFAGAVFEAAGESNDASVAYRRARALSRQREREAGLWEIAAVDPPGRTRYRAEAAPGGSSTSADSGDVVVVVERGFIVRRISTSLNVVIWPRELEILRSVEEGLEQKVEESLLGSELGETRRELARRVAARALERRREGGAESGPDRAVSGPVGPAPPTGSRDGAVAESAARRGDGRRTPGRAASRRTARDAPYLLRVAFARLARPFAPRSRVRIRADRGPAAGPHLTMDLSSALRREFRADVPERLARAVLRAAVKYGVTRAVEEGISEESETLGDVAGFAVNAVLSGMERADLRSWHLLPTRLELARLRLPAGRRRLVVETAPPGETPREIGIGEVTVRPGGLSVLTARVWE